MFKVGLSFVAFVAFISEALCAIYLPNGAVDGQTYTYTQATYDNQGVVIPTGQFQSGFNQNVQLQNGNQEQGVYTQGAQYQNGYVQGQVGTDLQSGFQAQGGYIPPTQVHVTNTYVQKDKGGNKGLIGGLLGTTASLGGNILGAGMSVLGLGMGGVLGGPKSALEMANAGANIGSALGNNVAQHAYQLGI